MSSDRGLSAGNGCRPTSIWYAMIPRAYWSAAGPATSDPPALSGAMYSAVPMSEPACVIPDPGPTIFARPKSVSTGMPSRVSRMFCGLMSR